ncbi:TonB-dependent receptor plug domain-containing protein [Altibacter sp.]|uniref:TonB-dependent receptor n=1 Tax=Altibacter sp. TaxID=2024823 RepID=UPI0025B9D503|nr:TonB-dependent receptor plug domain-containing protein [Altibacter sp.]
MNIANNRPLPLWDPGKMSGVILWVLVLCVFCSKSHAQEISVDSLYILPVDLNEVVILGAKKRLTHQKQHKPLSSLDEYLETAQKINLIKRGAYAWEPSLNNMTSERLAVTIDGMQIFGACTDKMDPTTSYVDVSNLEEAQIQSGQQGALFGNTIGGGINMKLGHSRFKDKGWYGSVENAYESNNNLRIVGAELNYSKPEFYIDGDIIYRKADNYFAGDGEEVVFSQFEKYNISLNSGIQFSEGKKLATTLLFDQANDVGYPALPMDVSLARAVITSVSWQQDSITGNFKDWETKIYYNNIKHVMDDTKRPNVPIHMDMPGWSTTAGVYSQMERISGKHALLFKIDGFYNRSLAEMTMYPNDPNENEMFMLTWPDVRTTNTGIYLADIIALKSFTVALSGRLGLQNTNVADDFGFNSLKIFYPEMERSNTRFLKSFSVTFSKDLNAFSMSLGAAYGERAPSVSEGFGFYLFNSFDAHDYIGNPNLTNEQSLETNAKVSYKKEKLSVSAEVNFFHIPNYIIGVLDSNLSPMTIGAAGVRVYTNLEYAQVFNSAMSAKYQLLKGIHWSAGLSWHRGTDNEGENLPLISPLTYNSSLSYTGKRTSASISVSGNGVQENFSVRYGEDQTNAYTVVSATLGRRLVIHKNDLYAKAGIENIFDTSYSTFSDWNNIPRMGRNIFMSLSYSIN